MSVPRFSFDPARKIKIFIRVNRNGTRTLIFNNPNGTAYNITAIDWEFFIKQNSNSNNKVISLTIGEGLTIVDTNKLQVALTEELTDIRDKEYYWELLNITAAETWLCGPAIVHDGEFDDFTADEEFTIAAAGNNVEITVVAVTEGGGPGGPVEWDDVQNKPTSFPSDWDDVANKPTEFPPSSHNHNDIYYTKAEVDDISFTNALIFG